MQKVPKSTYQGARKHHDLWTIRLIMQRNIFYQVKGSRSQRSKSLKKVEVSNLLKLRSVTRVTLQFSTSVEPRQWDRSRLVGWSRKVIILPSLRIFRNSVTSYRGMNQERWHGPISREKSISLIIHENRFWPFSRFWDLEWTWYCILW